VFVCMFMLPMHVHTCAHTCPHNRKAPFQPDSKTCIHKLKHQQNNRQIDQESGKELKNNKQITL
jgi:hypothetical protein